MTADLSIETLQGRREWQGILKVMKEKNLQPGLLYPARISSKYEGKIKSFQFSSVQFSLVAQSHLTLCNPMNRSTPGLPVHHQLLEFTHHIHRVSDAKSMPYRLKILVADKIGKHVYGRYLRLCKLENKDVVLIRSKSLCL